MLTVAVAGLGGFAAEHHAALAILEAQGVCRVVAACDPDPTLEGGRFRFAERGVGVYASLEALLAAHRPSLLTLPTPIPLHAAQHAMAVEAGVACYLEKPPSLWWPEFQAMRGIDRGATQVGFNFVGDPFRRSLKGRILAGEFGALREATLHAVWPRDAAYYARNDWAGRLRVGERWVLDSCIGNALAHYVQNLLFWCGTEGVDSVGRVREVRAWLGRTRPIESYDTALVEAQVEDATVRIGATHGAGANSDRETLVFERARITFDRWDRARIDGGETIASEIPDQGALLRHNLAQTLDFVAGRRDRPTTRLADAASFVALCDLALVSSGAIHEVRGLDLGGFVEEGRWPAGVPETVGMDDLPRLVGTASRLVPQRDAPPGS